MSPAALDPTWFSHTSRLLGFLLDCGSWIHDDDSRNGTLMNLGPNTNFGQEGSLGLRLLDLDFPFKLTNPHSLTEKRELRYLISHHNDCACFSNIEKNDPLCNADPPHKAVDIPDVARIIILESESELRERAKAELISLSYNNEGWSLLGLSFGWPQGLQILLQAGVDASRASIQFVEDNPRGETYESVKLLLGAGCQFGFHTISHCQRLEGENRIQSLLIQEMATRIRKLWDLAQIHLPLNQLPNLVTHEMATDQSYIYDVHVFETRAKLEAQGTEIDPRISTPHTGFSESISCFSCQIISAETLESFYSQGFRGVDGFDEAGSGPLQSTFQDPFCSRPSVWKLKLDRTRWLVSRGALLHPTVPGTNASIAHTIGVSAARLLIDTILQPRLFNFDECFRAWKQAILQTGEGWFLLSCITDECRCPCSPHGCTTMSVVLRHILCRFKMLIHKPVFPSAVCRALIQFFIEFSEETPVVHEEFIRCFTFHALDLNHACCIEAHASVCLKLRSREEEEIEEIIDEQKLRLIDFEKLVIEFQAKFDELALPMIEFLEGYWYNRMIEYLRQRDRYDEGHAIGSRSIGVNLQQEEEFSLTGVLLLVGSFNKVLDNEVSPMIE